MTNSTLVIEGISRVDAQALNHEFREGGVELHNGVSNADGETGVFGDFFTTAVVTASITNVALQLLKIYLSRERPNGIVIKVKSPDGTTITIDKNSSNDQQKLKKLDQYSDLIKAISDTLKTF